MEQITGIIRVVSAWDFSCALEEYFSGDAADFLYDYYTDLSADIGEPIELDPIAINCEWYEYETDTAFVSDMRLGDIEDIHEELSDIQDSDYIYGYQVYRLENGNLMVLQ